MPFSASDCPASPALYACTWRARIGHAVQGSGVLRNHLRQKLPRLQNEKMLGEYRQILTDYRAAIDELDQSLGKILGTIQAGLRDYNQSIENNFKEIVKISNPMISVAASFIQTQIDELSGQFKELGSVIKASMEQLNGRRTK
jgi:hypothetical protein